MIERASNLYFIELMDNQLMGTIPEELFRKYEYIITMDINVIDILHLIDLNSQLKEIDLHGNLFTGPLPTTLCMSFAWNL